jgi:hypothetical protein
MNLVCLRVSFRFLEQKVGIFQNFQQNKNNKLMPNQPRYYGSIQLLIKSHVNKIWPKDLALALQCNWHFSILPLLCSKETRTNNQIIDSERLRFDPKGKASTKNHMWQWKKKEKTKDTSSWFGLVFLSHPS